MATLEDAIALAVTAHRGQVDKAGAPYILHPLRMMCRMESSVAMMTAVLHDVVEDSATTLDDLRALAYPDIVVDAVDCLTRRDGESYDRFLERVRPNALARRVKLADLEDNLDVRRIREPQARDLSRLKQYRRAWQDLVDEDPVDAVDISRQVAKQAARAAAEASVDEPIRASRSRYLS